MIKLISQISGTAGNGDVDAFQGGGIISGDGNLIVLRADSQNLVPGSPIGTGNDILLFNANNPPNQQFKNLTAVQGDGATTTNQSSSVPGISADGTKVVFESDVENLDPSITSTVFEDIYLTTDLGAVVPTHRLITRGYDDDSRDPSISADGNWVAFQTAATNFNNKVDNSLTDTADAADTDDDIILVQLSDLDNPIWISQKSGQNGNAGNDGSFDPSVAIDSEGNPLVVFQSDIPANNLIDGTFTDNNTSSDIFLWRNGILTLVSRSALNANIAGNGDSDDPVISADGKYIAYESTSSDLVANGTTVQDIYRYNIETGETQIISLRPNNEPTTGSSDDPSISQDGTSIAFESFDANLVPSDDNGVTDIFVWKEGSGVSLISADNSGNEGNQESRDPAISLDGLKVTFESDSTNLDPTVLGQNGTDDQLFLVDLTAPTALSIDDVTVNEDAGTATLTVSLSETIGSEVTVDYTTVDGTATAGSDYEAKSGTVTIPANSPSGTITINIIDDAVEEPEELFNVELSNPSSNATISDNEGIVTISANDLPPLPSLSINDVTVNEDAGTATLTVSLSEVATAEVTVDYATADDTATAGSDYETKSGTVTIPTGSSSGQITINIIDDNTQEPDELFNVQLSNPSSNAAIADDIGLVAITDNDSSTSPIISDFGGNGSGAEQSDALLYLGVALNNDNLINSFADSANALAPGTVVNSLAEIKAGVNDNISELDLGGNGIGGEQSDALLYLGVTLNNDNLINSFADSANALAPGTVVNSLSQIKAFFEA